MFRFIKAVEDFAKALNRFSDLWEAEQQEETDERAIRLQQANQRSKRAIDRIKEAVANQQD